MSHFAALFGCLLAACFNDPTLAGIACGEGGSCPSGLMCCSDGCQTSCSSEGESESESESESEGELPPCDEGDCMLEPSEECGESVLEVSCDDSCIAPCHSDCTPECALLTNDKDQRITVRSYANACHAQIVGATILCPGSCEQSPDCQCTQCTYDHCRQQWTGCVFNQCSASANCSDDVGCSCLDVADCVRNCGEDDCRQLCTSSACPSANNAWQALEDCIAQECPTECFVPDIGTL